MEKDVCLSCCEGRTKKNSEHIDAVPPSHRCAYTKCDTNKIDDPNSVQEACHI